MDSVDYRFFPARGMHLRGTELFPPPPTSKKAPLSLSLSAQVVKVNLVYKGLPLMHFPEGLDVPADSSSYFIHSQSVYFY